MVVWSGGIESIFGFDRERKRERESAEAVRRMSVKLG